MNVDGKWCEMADRTEKAANPEFIERLPVEALVLFQLVLGSRFLLDLHTSVFTICQNPSLIKSP